MRTRAKVSRKGIGERALRARILVYNVYQNLWAKICQIGNNVRREIAALNRNFKTWYLDVDILSTKHFNPLRNVLHTGWFYKIKTMLQNSSLVKAGNFTEREEEKLWIKFGNEIWQ